jgi:hypothetical protein
MQTLLLVITLGSLAMTIVLAAILVRLIRFERRREAVRVDLLREMADEASDYGEVDRSDVDFPAGDQRGFDRSEIDRPAVEAPDFRLRDTIDVAPARASADLFAHSEQGAAWPRRAAVAAAIAALIVAGVFGLRRPSAPAGAPRSDVPTATTGASPPQTPALLELLSLKQTQEGGALTITGLVQNPRDGAALSKIVATAMLFDSDGTFLASGRAPLDFTVLRPGDESGFVITVPVKAPVARYRVGFRNEDGHVIGHIDRRTASTLATGTANASVPARGTS